MASKNQATRVVMLGTGTPNPTPERSGPAVAVVVGERAYLVDFGSGVIRRCEEARRMGTPALAPHKLHYAFCTHLHSDHTLGLADLIFTPWVLGRSEPLQLFGPLGLKDMVSHTTAAFAVDIAGRQASDSPTPPRGYLTEVSEISQGLIYEDGLVSVEAFSVNHPPFDAFGYRFTTKDRTIVISGDTAPSENLIKYATDCDLLIHEVISHKGVQQRSPEWRAYHTAVHTSSLELGQIAAQARVGMLVLYHQLFMCGENETGQEAELMLREQEMLAEIRQSYKGPLFSARDLDIH